jgi:aryl-alcohol dehydrogenase-like predicted oxidoreductase
LDRSIERELIPLAQTYGLAILPWSPLARGFLTGKYKRGEPVPGDTRLEGDMQGPFQQRTQKHFSDRAYDLLAVVEDLATAKNCTPGQFALAWVNQQPGVTSSIIGPRTMEQFNDNLGAVSILITPEDRAEIDAVAEPELAIVPYYHGSMIDFKPSQFGWH